MEWEKRNELLKSFEDGGFLYNNACGVIETDEHIIFFLGEGEKVDANALRWMYEWGFDNNLKLIGATFKDENIPIDDWYYENHGEVKNSIKVLFEKEPWFE